MTKKEAKNLINTAPLPEKWKGKQKVREHVYCSLFGDQTRVAARRRLKRAKSERKEQDGFYCPGGQHEGIFEEYGTWYVYLHFARYE